MATDLAKINELIQINLSTCFMHQSTFPQFKEIHRGQDICIVASGVTADKYTPVEGRIHIGVNRSFQIGNYRIPMDYVFLQDYSGKTKEYIDELDEYRADECQKFYGLTLEWVYSPERVIPESHAIKANALRYRTAYANIEGFTQEFAYDISTRPLACFGSVVFPALQFALWTYPRKIYLVGCDCTTSGYAYNPKEQNFLVPAQIITAYKKFKIFAHKYYPDVEIINVNPVGLKGLFKEE